MKKNELSLVDQIKTLKNEVNLLKAATSQILTRMNDEYFCLDHDVEYVKLKEDAKEPFKKHDGDAGYDLFAYVDGQHTIMPGELAKIATGIAISLNDNSVGLIHDRSSMASKQIATVGGVIDEPYTGEISILLINHSKQPYEIKNGDKIAQILIQPVVKAKFNLVKELKNTARGDKGFGSTGK